MKRYVWVGVVLLCVGVYAVENPFALDTNFKKLDQEQTALLAKLKKIAKAKELEEAKKPTVQKVSVAPVAKEVNVAPNKPVEEISKNKAEEAKVSEAYEKARAERIAQEEEKKDFPATFQFYDMLVHTKIDKKGAMLKGKAKEVFENLLKEKNNPNFSLEEAQKMLAGNKEVGFALLAYIMGKSSAMESVLSGEKKKKVEELLKTFKPATKTEIDKFAKEHPEEMRRLGFDLVEDIVNNGVPDTNLNFSIGMSGNLTAGKVSMTVNGKPVQIQESESTSIDDINLTRERLEEKRKADEAFAKAVLEMGEEAK